MLTLDRIYSITLAACLVALSVPLSFAHAGCVNPDGSDGCHSTIQAAVDAAAAAEVIEIAKGRYVENVSIPVGKDGLVLRGKSAKVSIVDADLPNTGTGITVESANVTIEKLMVLHGAVDGIDIQPTATNTTITDVIVQGQPDRCIASEGTNTTVNKSLLRGCRYGIEIGADNLTVTSTRFTQTQSAAILGTSHGTAVEKASVSHIESSGIVISGNEISVRNSRFDFVPSTAVSVTGSGARIEKNKFSNVGRAIRVQSYTFEGFVADDTRITGNKIQNVFGSGIDHDCVTTCTINEISGNKIKNCFDDTAIAGSTSDGDYSILNNKIIGGLENGIIAQPSSTGTFVVAGNKVIGTGSQSQPAIDGSGDGLTFAGNKVLRCGGTGIQVTNADNGTTVLGNKIIGGLGRGIDLGANSGVMDPNLVQGNKIIKNRSEGIKLNPSANNTLLAANTVLKNSADLCDAGVGTIDDGTNKIGTYGPCN